MLAAGVGVIVVVVVGMEEEMEERMVEELVVAEMVVGMKGGWPKEGMAHCNILGCCWLAGNEEGKEKMKERERKVDVYISKK